MSRVSLVALTLAIALVPATSVAQPLRFGGAHPGSIEAAAGVVWTSGYDAGRTQATETRNPSVGSSPFTLFNADARLRSVGGLELLADVYLSQRVALEVDGQFSRPIFAVHLSTDAESAADTTATETLTQYLAGASVLYHLQGTDRFVPFVGFGGSYLRQVHDSDHAVNTGTELHALGGIKYWFTARPRAFGIRFEARASSRDRSVALTPHRQLIAELRGGVAYRF